jgi:hypothetical protein
MSLMAVWPGGRRHLCLFCGSLYRNLVRDLRWPKFVLRSCLFFFQFYNYLWLKVWRVVGRLDSRCWVWFKGVFFSHFLFIPPSSV